MKELFILLELQEKKAPEEALLNQEEGEFEINPYTAEIQKMPIFSASDLYNLPSILEI